MAAILQNIFFIALSAQAFYYLVVFSRLYFLKAKKNTDTSSHGISVIICAHNDAEQLRKNLPYILQQDYPQFEVIVVNDGSTDYTSFHLEQLQLRHPQLKVKTIGVEEKLNRGKKQALSAGIEVASFEHLLLTDADCRPVSSDWIREMSSSFTEESHLVLGLGPHISRKDSVSALVDYETAQTALQYISYALWEMPYMGVGRNLAYSKTLFNKAGGLSSHFELPSGDDDLLVQQAEKLTKTHVCISPQSLMYSPAPISWKAWFRQKTRHYSTGKHYQFLHRLFLGAYLFTKLVLYVSFVACLVLGNISSHLWQALLAYWSVSALAHLLFQVKSSFNTRFLLTPILDPLYTVLSISLGTFSSFSSSKHWK